ncbi:MAG: ABC transporter ATP-binding protein [Chloroflexi bacterium]|nr:ABC transporter ATP-binding protein [Chloroflexota bacterium]MCI0863719.1 ABC transporter ATP-binding protein [Chloroflexota bacterium]
MLKLKDVHASYGQVSALHGVSLEVPEAQIVTVLGANGSGKSATIKAIAGLLPVTAGSIRFQGQEIGGLSADRIVRLGISVVPEGRQLFSEMTVLENLRLGAFTLGKREQVRRQMDQVISYFPRLGDRLRQPANSLSGGEQQMLAIGRALMARPKLLILDEPSIGLAPILVEELFARIKDLSEREGITVLLAEQNANQALSVADYGYVLETGSVVLQDTAQNLLKNEELRGAYLGF